MPTRVNGSNFGFIYFYRVFSGVNISTHILKNNISSPCSAYYLDTVWDVAKFALVSGAL